jgi:hypothetical protein
VVTDLAILNVRGQSCAVTKDRHCQVGLFVTQVLERGDPGVTEAGGVR